MSSSGSSTRRKPSGGCRRTGEASRRDPLPLPAASASARAGLEPKASPAQMLQLCSPGLTLFYPVISARLPSSQRNHKRSVSAGKPDQTRFRQSGSSSEHPNGSARVRCLHGFISRKGHPSSGCLLRAEPASLFWESGFDPDGNRILVIFTFD